MPPASIVSRFYTALLQARGVGACPPRTEVALSTIERFVAVLTIAAVE